MNKSNAI